MNSDRIPNIKISRLNENATIPYHLLLLADPYKNAVEKYLNSSEIYVAGLQDKLVGVFVLYPLTRDIIEIKSIAVEENFQGCGIGKLMLVNAAKISKDKNYTTIVIGTGNSSISQLSLYQKQGFEIFDIKKNFFVDNYIIPIFEDGIQCKHMIMLSKKL